MQTLLEEIVTLSKTEGAASKACLVNEFLEEPHTISELAVFFQWLSERLNEGDIEFQGMIYKDIKLNHSSSRLLAMWLLRTVSA